MNVPRACATPFLIFCLCMTGSLARAFHPPAHERLENFDRRANGAARARRDADVNHRAAVARLRDSVPDLRLDVDEALATPVWVRSSRGFLTGRNGEGRAVPPATASRFPADDPARAAKAFVEEHSGVFGHGSEALSRARVQRDFVTPGTGTRTLIWEQHVDGVPVFGGVFSAHITKHGELISLSSRFHPDPERGARGRNRAALLPAADAVSRAAAAIEEPLAPNSVTSLDAQQGARRSERFRAGTLPGEARAALVWLPLDDDELRLCWEVFVKRRTGGELFRVLIDADTGEPWTRHCLTKYVADPTFRVWTSDSPTPMSPGWPTPNTNQPPEMPRSLVTVSGLNTNVSPLGWIGEGLNETIGNNVDAHLDHDANDVADLPRPQGDAQRAFDFPANLALTPTANADAAVVQLFYWCNWAHDRFYEMGFTEAAGNFQSDNLGRGGIAGDAVQADAQDGSGFNNANMTTPPDGAAPRMQMYLFVNPSPDRDGDLDAEVILHEYTHGLTDRLVGAGAGLLNVQSEGLAEGWSDFYALSLLSEPADDVNANYPIGGYVALGLLGGQENYYFGIRHYPYCTDMATNPVTFKDIDPLQISPHTGVPRGPIGGGASEPHAQGEVWCSALWEARALFVQRLGWTNGNQLMLQLVTDALPLTPANPTFLQARDAIIQADLIRTGGANYRDLWTAFAKRGLGASATSPGSSTTIGVVEAFDVPDDLVLRPSDGFLANGPVGGPFLPAMRNYSLTNLGTNIVLWSAASTSAWLQAIPASGTLPPGASTNFIVSLSPAAATLPPGVLSNTVTLSNATIGFTQTRQFTLRIGQPDFFTEQFAENDNDLSFQQITFRPDGSTNFYAACRAAMTNFPTDPSGGLDLGLGDDSFFPVTLSGTNSIALYGRRTNTFFIGSNGYITFDQGDNSHTRTFANHFGRPRVAGFIADLDPDPIGGGGGSVTWKVLPDRVAITWERVPEWEVNNENSLQIEMFHDGIIRLTWLRMDARRGVVGLSRGGGMPPAFVESDLTLYGECPPPIMVSMNVTNGCALLQWPALPGVTYRVDFRSELNVGSWNPLGTTTATNSVGAAVDCPAGEPQRFYRVVIP